VDVLRCADAVIDDCDETEIIVIDADKSTLLLGGNVCGGCGRGCSLTAIYSVSSNTFYG
jgi:hypothetical protein